MKRLVEVIAFIMLLYILFSLFGCRVVPEKKIETELDIKGLLNAKIKAKLSQDIRNMPTNLGCFGGYFSGYYNGRQFMHERYAQFHFNPIPVDQITVQINKKVRSWMLGQHNLQYINGTWK